VIPPGSEGKIFANVDIEHYKGPIQKSIDVRSNDPAKPNQKLFIKAEVKVYVDVQPAEQVRLLGHKGEALSQELTLVPQKGVKILSATDPAKLVNVNLQPSGNEYKLNVSLKDGLAVGTYTSTISVVTEGPVKQINIPVVALIRGPLNVNPPVVSFYITDFPAEVTVAYTTDIKQAPEPGAIVTEKVETGRSFRVISQNSDWYQVITFEQIQKMSDGSTIPSRKIGWISKAAVKTLKESPLPGPQKVIVQNSENTLKVLDYSTDLNQIKIQAENQNPNTYQFTVTLMHLDRSKKGSVKGAIKVKTDNTQQPELSIPVVITVG
jgi:hypothetical protein